MNDPPGYTAGHFGSHYTTFPFAFIQVFPDFLDPLPAPPFFCS